MQIISLKIDDELLEQLHNFCAKNGHKQSVVLRDAIRYYLGNTQTGESNTEGNTEPAGQGDGEPHLAPLDE